MANDTWVEIELNNIMLMLGCECALWQVWHTTTLYCSDVRIYRHTLHEYLSGYVNNV